eukprot:CAMPEP_0170626318 /NCGR_PEP_ID=MMETSP0224-20130122/31289_1 /TAXON_ID=285029 /ORGANISM="Togula jolla, Strain CCCM 725" /LENGTH=133 /DNA_ID=CAMNT_0010953073 /DNA_START=74 /DNA_END=475 /DNA_ORIENTATION=+
MGKFNDRTHDLMMQGGFRYDSKKDKYFQHSEPTWDKQKRIEKGKKQLAVPASSVKEFLEGEVKMVDALLARVREKAKAEGKKVKEEGDPSEDEAPPPKKAKKAEADEEEAPKKEKKEKKEKKAKREAEEEEEE